MNVNLGFLFLLLSIFLAQSFAAKDCGYGMYYDGQYCSDCGIATVDPNVRIVGGVQAVKGSWPAQVLVTRYTDFFGIKILKSLCGGTLISRYTVLSAAHCIGSSQNDVYYIYAGAYNITSILKENFPDPDVSVHLARKVIRHPSYDNETLLNDIALFLLDEPITITDNISVACLPRISVTYPPYNTTVYLAGWGLDAANGSISKVLQNINMTVYDPDYCYYVDETIPKDWDTQICAGEYSGGKGACMGDSGGALVHIEYINNQRKYFASGIVSYGIPCALEELPTIFTRTSYYIDWIKANWQTEPLPTTTTKLTSTDYSSTSSKTTYITFTDKPSASVKLAYSIKYNFFALLLLNLILISL